jgi:hypothetical protein
LLGLDRLAKEKREQAIFENGPRKKPRLNDDTVFKGAINAATFITASYIISSP